jgi:hypothetical protein
MCVEVITNNKHAGTILEYSDGLYYKPGASDIIHKLLEISRIDVSNDDWRLVAVTSNGARFAVDDTARVGDFVNTGTGLVARLTRALIQDTCNPTTIRLSALEL